MNAAVPCQRAWLESTGLKAPDLGPGLNAVPIEAGLAELSRQPDVKALVLFGSRARGQAAPRSDLDLIC